MDCHQFTSVDEFIQSGRLSDGLILLHDRDEKERADVTSDSPVGSRLVVENAARLALSLTQSYAAHLSTKSHGDGCSNVTHYFELRDFDIHLGFSSGFNDETPNYQNYFDQMISAGLFDENDQSTTVGRSSEKSSLQELDHDNGTEWDTACKMYRNMTLLGMDIVPRSRGNTQGQGTEKTPLQTLGNLLYLIFSQGEGPPLNLSESSTPSQSPSLSPANETATSKRSFSKRRTVFSQLVQNTALPKSVCRLLSDLIDTGPNGNADNPFTSIEEVLQDLNEMISQPQIFLHDSISSHNLTFGQNTYGRNKEVSTLFQVAVNMVKKVVSPREADVCSQIPQLESVFVAGKAGIGKSHVLEAVGNMLNGEGWIVIRAKFERSYQHSSQRILSGMFDQIISYLVKMKQSNKPSDVAYSQRASQAMLNTIGYDNLTFLFGFLPSLPLLFGCYDSNENMDMQTEDANWQLIASLSNILKAVLEQDRFLLMCCDDIHWADKTSIELVDGVIKNIGADKSASQHCLFVGLYRDDEVGDNFYSELSSLKMCNNIKMTEIKLGMLSKKDMEDMLSTELRLPHRVVLPLAEVVFKKTTGHPLYATELLNSLIRESIVAYSAKKGCYNWDFDRLSFIQTSDNVAQLIASNFKSSLSQECHHILQLLSCFGIQSDTHFLQLLDGGFCQGILLALDTFVELGILETAGGINIFAHDIIQQTAYESIPIHARKLLHLQIGQYLGKIASVDNNDGASSSVSDALSKGIGHLQVNDEEYFTGSSSRLTSTLLSIACDQVNMAGPDTMNDPSQKLLFAQWNMMVGKKMLQACDFQASLYYISKGIEFLGDNCWECDALLCYALHEDGVRASFSLSDDKSVARYTQSIVGNVPFEKSLDVQHIYLRSLSNSEKHTECMQKGLEVLRKLNLDFPHEPSPSVIMKAVASTEAAVSSYSIDQMLNLCETRLDDSVHRVVKIMDSIFVSCWTSASPFLPLIACEMVKFSLMSGISYETMVAYAAYGMFRILFVEDYAGGRYWAGVVRQMMEKLCPLASAFKLRPEILMSASIDIWQINQRTISKSLLEHSKYSMNIGQIDNAMICLSLNTHFSILGGDNLQLIAPNFEDHYKQLVTHSPHSMRSVIPARILLMELTGLSFDCFSVFEGSIRNIDDLKQDAKKINDQRSLYGILVYSLVISYWKDDYITAEKHTNEAWKMPTAKTPSIFLIYHVFYRGLVAFEQHRSLDCDQRLKDGQEALVKVKKWAENCKEVFQNKYLLLKAEYYSAMTHYDQSEKMYKASISVARDHGNVHEMALAHELLGNFYSGRGNHVDSMKNFKEAFVYYNQWGASAIANKLMRKHNLSVDKEDATEIHGAGGKRSR